MTDATQYGLNPGVETNAFISTITRNQQTPRLQDEGSRIFSRWDQMDTEAINWKLHWQRCYEYIVPRKEDVIAVRMPGDDRESDIYDTTAVLANEQLGSALHSMLTNPETRFFELLFGDPKLDELPAVKAWCQECGDRMYQVLNSSNFQTEIYEMYIDLTAAGTGHLYMDENEDTVIQFSARALKEIRIDEDASGMVDTIYRVFKLRPFQILKMWPELLKYGDDIQMAADKNPIDQIEIIHAVEPADHVRDEQHQMKLKYKKHRISSTYMLKDKKWILSQSSYAEMPYASPRWSKTTGEKYGRGPGMSMLPDIQMVNAMMETLIKGAQLTVGPPMAVEDDSVIGQIIMTPFGVTAIRPGSPMPKPFMQGGSQVEFGEKVVDNVRSRIRAGFYVDQLQLPKESPQRTAEEVRQIAEEQMRLMGPILGRQHFELLGPLITRLFGIMWRKGLLPAAPEAIKGKKLAVRYSSLIARAQRMQEAQNITRAMQTLQPLAQVMPGIMDLVKIDDLGREVWDIYGNKSSLLLTPRELEAKRKQQAQHGQKLSQQADQLHQSQVAKNVSPLIQTMQQNQGQGQAPVAPGAQ